MNLKLIVLLLLIPNGMTVRLFRSSKIEKECRYIPVSVGESELRSIVYYYDTKARRCTRGIFKSFVTGANKYPNLQTCQKACAERIKYHD